MRLRILRDSFVSIHASSREDATYALGAPVVGSAFQSTRPRGRTRQTCKPTSFIVKSFNPRVLAGGRDIWTAI